MLFKSTIPDRNDDSEGVNPKLKSVKSTCNEKDRCDTTEEKRMPESLSCTHSTWEPSFSDASENCKGVFDKRLEKTEGIF